jgi:2-phospho-L-lactate transferase/gluconeogenesis factor (CofD/UPF0052 family)
MLRAYDLPVSPVGIAEVYDGLLDGLVIDSRDQKQRDVLERRGLEIAVTDIRMDTVERSQAVAALALRLGDRLAKRTKR